MRARALFPAKGHPSDARIPGAPHDDLLHHGVHEIAGATDP